jgi:hypothetical protein
LIWVGFFKWGVLHGFLKSHWKGQLQLPTTEPASKHKKAFEKALQILLRKDLPPIPSIKQPLEQNS